jgi:hypothetical protein
MDWSGAALNDISPDTLSRLATSLVFTDPVLTTPETAWSEHVPFAFWLIEAARPATLVELGVHSGLSYCGFCQAIGQLGLSTAAYGVDTWLGDAHAGEYGDDVLAKLRAHHDPLYAGFSHLVRETFDDARQHFQPGSIDVLHLDGLHTYDAVRHDFDSWLPQMSVRGVVLLHDIGVRERDFGVWRLWEELSNEYPSFAFPFGNGLGVLGVGEDLPEPVRWLLLRDSRSDSDEAIMRFFSILGERQQARAGMARALRDSAVEKDRHEAETASWRQAEDARRAELDVCRAELDVCRAELEMRRDEIATILASSSWRITAPLRLLMGAARRVTGGANRRLP